jgi:hypothetical protein
MGTKNLLIIVIVMLIGIFGILFTHIKYESDHSEQKEEKIFEEVNSKINKNT